MDILYGSSLVILRFVPKPITFLGVSLIRLAANGATVHTELVIYRAMQTISQFVEVSPFGTAAVYNASKDKSWSILLLLLGVLDLVLTNGYKGVVIENIMAPLLSNPPQNVEDLIKYNFSLYSIQTKTHSPIFVIMNMKPISIQQWVTIKDELGRETFQQWAEWWREYLLRKGLDANLPKKLSTYYVCRSIEQHNTSAEPIYDYFRACTKKYSNGEVQSIQRSANVVQDDVNNAHFIQLSKISKPLGNTSLLFDTIRKCENSAFLVNVNQLGKDGTYLKRILGPNSKRTLYKKSKSSVFSVSTVSLISEGTNLKVSTGKRIIQKLLESGLYNFWKKFVTQVTLHNHFKHKKEAGNVQPLKLSSNIATIFVMFSMFCGLAMSSFFIEIVTPVCKKLYDQTQNQRVKIEFVFAKMVCFCEVQI